MPLADSNSSVHPEDTIVAVSSAPGCGHRAIVRISGPGAAAAIAAVFSADEPRPNSVRSRCLVPGSLKLTGVFSTLPASLYFFAGPKTYTGQDLAEIHTIGSPPLVERLVADLLNAGTRPARPGEFTLRAFLAGKKDLPQAEAVHAVIEAGTDDELEHALVQLGGGVTQPLHALREDLLNLLADLEAALDFADEDIEFVGKSETLERLARALDHLSALKRQLDERTVSGRPIRIAFVGLPNAGKSSLFNALGGSEALVSAIPGTTRDYLTRRIDLAGTAVELIDTAGWQDASDSIESQAQALASQESRRADVVVWCVEAGGEFALKDAAILAQTRARVLRVSTKCDLADPAPYALFGTSTVATGGTDALRAALKETVLDMARSALAPSQSRCLHHVDACLEELVQTKNRIAHGDPPELAAASLRMAIDRLGEMTGAVYTNDLLDRIFSRFCIGK